MVTENNTKNRSSSPSKLFSNNPNRLRLPIHEESHNANRSSSEGSGHETKSDISHHDNNEFEGTILHS